MVFSVLGFAAERAGVPVGQVATAGPGLAFVTYPAAVVMMPAPNFWAITFFVMLFFLGIDSMVSMYILVTYFESYIARYILIICFACTYSQQY